MDKFNPAFVSICIIILISGLCFLYLHWLEFINNKQPLIIKAGVIQMSEPIKIDLGEKGLKINITLPIIDQSTEQPIVDPSTGAPIIPDVVFASSQPNVIAVDTATGELTPVSIGDATLSLLGVCDGKTVYWDVDIFVTAIRVECTIG